MSDIAFLESVYKGQINEGIQDAYALRVDQTSHYHRGTLELFVPP